MLGENEVDQENEEYDSNLFNYWIPCFVSATDKEAALKKAESDWKWMTNASIEFEYVTDNVDMIHPEGDCNFRSP